VNLGEHAVWQQTAGETLLRVARELLDLPGRLRYRRKLSRRRISSPVGRPVVAFGESRPRDGEIIHGGRVKLLQLMRAFAHNEEEFNVLYLVSSAIPRHALELVRWAKRGGAKFVWNQNGVGFPAWAGTDWARVNRPMAELLQAADFVVYQSAFCKESAGRWLGAAKSASEVLFNPVDLAAFGPAIEPPPLDCWRLLAAGTHHQPFRVLGAIETLQHLCAAGQPARLTVAGELRWPGAEREVRETIKRAGVGNAVELLPPFTQAAAVDLLRSTHVLLHGKYHDPCPTMVIEALACGIPVVGSRSGGMPELLGADGGELVEVPRTWERSAYPKPEEMAAAINRIMREWPLRSCQARARAERLFDAGRWVDAHGRIFRSLLGN
jgi:glycosyltransferase involved in cell wall biosynthesis